MAKRFGKRRRYHHRRKNPLQLKLKKQTVYTVGAIWLWLFAGTITLAFFSEGSVLSSLREQLTYHVGWVMYGLPPFLVTLSFLFFKIKSEIGSPNVPFGLGIVLASLMGISQAGTAGTAIWNIAAGFLSTEGAVLAYLAMLVVGFMILFNASLDRIINFILTGTTTIIDAVANFFGNMGSKREKPRFDQEKLPIEKPVIKEPLIQPSVSGKTTTAAAVSACGSVIF